MKKYLEPEIELLEFEADCIMASGIFEEGESLWENETPLIPFN